MGTRQKTKTKLKQDDWKDLFPGSSFKIGDSTLRIEPLSLKSLSLIMDKVSAIVTDLAQLDLKLADIQDGGTTKIVSLVHLIVVEAPEILSEMSSLDVDDVKELPLEIAVELFNQCLDVNLESQDSLLKNFKELGVKLERFVGAESQVPQDQSSE